mmetsp:Transcript_5501/g.11985  ORF Transcript_5501/g.11985 Transcript_5501/m.11985 type:complete len:242 (+) Transcript_5501:868-1593(+)
MRERLGDDVLFRQFRIVLPVRARVRRSPRPPVVPLLVQRISHERLDRLLHGPQRFFVHGLLLVVPHDEAERRLHCRLGRASPLPHLTPRASRVQVELVTLLPLPRQRLLGGRLCQLGRTGVLRRRRGVSVLPQLAVAGGNAVESLQSIFSALLVCVRGALVEVGGADRVRLREYAPRHGLLRLEAVVLRLGHLGDLRLAGEDGEGGVSGDASGGIEDGGGTGSEGGVANVGGVAGGDGGGR